MLNVIKSILLKIIDDIDCGNSNITEDDASKIIDCLREYTHKDVPISKYSACVYLSIARSTFDKYVSTGKLPQGKKRQGFKELYWTKAELDDFAKTFLR